MYLSGARKDRMKEEEKTCFNCGQYTDCKLPDFCSENGIGWTADVEEEKTSYHHRLIFHSFKEVPEETLEELRKLEGVTLEENDIVEEGQIAIIDLNIEPFN